MSLFGSLFQGVQGLTAQNGTPTLITDNITSSPRTPIRLTPNNSLTPEEFITLTTTPPVAQPETPLSSPINITLTGTNGISESLSITEETNSGIFSSLNLVRLASTTSDDLFFTAKNLINTPDFRDNGNIQFNIFESSLSNNINSDPHIEIQSDEALDTTISNIKEVTVDLSNADDNSTINVNGANFVDVEAGAGDENITITAPQVINLGATTSIAFQANLNAEEDISAGTDFSRGISAYDEGGHGHNITINWEKIADQEWQATFEGNIVIDNATETVELGKVLSDPITFVFNGDGSLATINGQDPAIVTLDFVGIVGNNSDLFSLIASPTPTPIDFDFTGLTQFAGQYDIIAVDVERDNEHVIPEQSFYTIDGNAGDDHIQIYGNGFVNATVQGGAGNDDISLYTFSDGSLPYTNNTLEALGGAGDDGITGSDGRDRLYGQSGDDDIIGRDGDDRISGGNGDDFIHGGDGDDRLNGGHGDDRIDGGEGLDLLYGLDGDDELSGNEGDDRLIGGQGDDELSGNQGDDRLYGDNGEDVLIGGEGNDRLYGGNSYDFIEGNTGNDRLYGQDGNDDLYGGEGRDRIFGGNGDDRISGGQSSDRLYGDNGDDRLLFESIDTIVNGGEGNDVAQYDYSNDEYAQFNAVDITSDTFSGIEALDFVPFSTDIQGTRGASIGEVNIDINDILDISDTDVLQLFITDQTELNIDGFNTVEQGDYANTTIYSNGEASLEVITYNASDFIV